MIIRRVSTEERERFDQIVSHPVQSWAWGEFKEKTGMKPVRLGFFNGSRMVDACQVLFRPIPKTPWVVGHSLRGRLPSQELVDALRDLAHEENAIFIKLEPDYVVRRWKNKKGKVVQPPIIDKSINLASLGLVRGQRPLYDPHSFELDLTLSENELLANMHTKTRYNIRLALKKGVVVKEQSDEKGLEKFISLFSQTQKRQKFYFHSPDYFRQLWPVLRKVGMVDILLAEYQNETLGAWILFNFGDCLFYPYGASSSKYRELMASNLLCWQAICFGKKKGLKKFDLWGGLGPNADSGNPWFGFHRFKLGYGPDLVDYVDTWDLVTNDLFYSGVKIANKLRWKYLNLRKKFPF